MTPYERPIRRPAPTVLKDSAWYGPDQSQSCPSPTYSPPLNGDLAVCECIQTVIWYEVAILCGNPHTKTTIHQHHTDRQTQNPQDNPNHYHRLLKTGRVHVFVSKKNNPQSDDALLTWCLAVAETRRLSSSSSAILWLAAANCSSSSITRLCDRVRSSLSCWKSAAYSVVCTFSTAISFAFSSSSFFNLSFSASSSWHFCNVYIKITKTLNGSQR